MIYWVHKQIKLQDTMLRKQITRSDTKAFTGWTKQRWITLFSATADQFSIIHSLTFSHKKKGANIYFICGWSPKMSQNMNKQETSWSFLNFHMDCSPKVCPHTVPWFTIWFGRSDRLNKVPQVAAYPTTRLQIISTSATKITFRLELLMLGIAKKPTLIVNRSAYWTKFLTITD